MGFIKGGSMKGTTNYQVKDFILTGVLTALFTALYLAIAMATALAGPVVHVFSPILMALSGGVIYLLLASKVPKKFILTISTLIFMILMQLMGSGYLPWFITSVLSALIADGICIAYGYKNIKAIACGFGFMVVGQMLGNVLPVLLFANQFRETFVSGGADAAFLDRMIEFIQGPVSILLVSISFISGVIGIYVGQRLMHKHFIKAGIV